MTVTTPTRKVGRPIGAAPRVQISVKLRVEAHAALVRLAEHWSYPLTMTLERLIVEGALREGVQPKGRS